MIANTTSQRPRRWYHTSIFGCVVALLCPLPYVLLALWRYGSVSLDALRCSDGFDLLLNLLSIAAFCGFGLTTQYEHLVRPGASAGERLRQLLIVLGVAVVIALLVMPRIGFPPCLVPAG